MKTLTKRALRSSRAGNIHRKQLKGLRLPLPPNPTAPVLLRALREKAIMEETELQQDRNRRERIEKALRFCKHPDFGTYTVKIGKQVLGTVMSSGTGWRRERQWQFALPDGRYHPKVLKRRVDAGVELYLWMEKDGRVKNGVA